MISLLNSRIIISSFYLFLRKHFVNYINFTLPHITKCNYNCLKDHYCFSNGTIIYKPTTIT